MKKNETEEQLITTQGLDNVSANTNATETLPATSQIPNNSTQNANADDQKKSLEALGLQELLKPQLMEMVKQEMQRIENEREKKEFQEQQDQIIQENVKKMLEADQENINILIQKNYIEKREQIILERVDKKMQESQADIEKEATAEIQKQVSEHTSFILKNKIEEYDNSSEHSLTDPNDTQINENKNPKELLTPKKKGTASTNLIQDVEENNTIDELAQEVLRDLEDDDIKITSVKQLRDLLKNPEKEEYELEPETIQHLQGLSKEEKKDLFAKISDIENFEPEDMENPSIIDNFLSFFKEHLKKPLIQFVDKVDDAFDALVEKGAEILKEEVKENIGTGAFSQTINNIIDSGKEITQNLYEPGDLDKIESNEQKIIGGGTEAQQI